MLDIYIVEQKGSPGTDYSYEVSEIQRINPDKIICLSMAEVDAQLIFRDFFDRIKPWLATNNKLVNLVVPHLNNVFVEYGIKAEQTYGYIMHQMLYAYHSSLSYLTTVPDYYSADTASLLYTCYNHNHTTERAKVVDSLVRENLLADGVVTYHYPLKAEWKYHNGTRLMDESDYEIHNSAKPQYAPSGIPAGIKRGFFDIVTESRYGANEYFITEKTLKSILLMRPFITLSSVGYSTEYLANYIGIELYDEMFDYSFDKRESTDDRIDGIINNVVRLRPMLMGSLNKQNLYRQLIPKLLRNRNKIIDIFFDKTKIVPNCLQVIMSGVDYTLHGAVNNPMLYHMRNMKWITQ
jgi:hypothetical protein